MLLFCFVSFVYAAITTLSKADLLLPPGSPANSRIHYNSPFLVFLYFEKEDFNCPLCKEYKAFLKEINIEVKELNFVDNVELASRFLQHTFPAFIVRYRNQSYILEPESVEDLIDLVNNEKWTGIKPVRSRIDVNSAVAVVFSKFNRLIFLFINLYYCIMQYIPNTVISGLTLAIIAFLIYSIVDVLTMENNEKIKKD